MGQAKARKAEIDALKAKAHRKLLAIGAFYKDNQEDGFAIVLEADRFGQENLNSIALGIEECVIAEKKMFDSGNYAYFDGLPTKEGAIAAIIDQLTTAYRIFNNANGVIRTTKNSKTITKIEAETEMIAAITNIQLLEQIGELKADNFNGMTYQTELTRN